MLQFIGKQPLASQFIDELLETLEIESVPIQLNIRSRPIESGLELTFDKNNVWIGYDSKVTFARSLMLLKDCILHQTYQPVRETPQIQSLGTMIDCSRNAVLKVDTVKKLIRYLALMGYRTIQLYTEDTYELEGYPYFGYMRGSYTTQEIKEIVDYAREIGIEVIPCIQTLAHLAATLRWQAFDEVKDCSNILLVGEEKTYELIEAMIQHASINFKSKRINIGMDEAHDLGLGQYLSKNGYKERIYIMIEHLNRVTELCKKYGMQPMVWSDMFFRALSTNGDYDGTCDLSQNKVLAKLPKDIELIYWDYYNKEEAHYDQILMQHEKLPNPTLFAGGAWRWRGVVPDNTFSLYLSERALNQCIKHNVQEVFITAWGDNGGECATFTILPNLVYYGERAYGEVDKGLLARRFEVLTGTSWENFLLLDQGNHLPDNPGPGRCSVNPSKYLFFQDVLLGLFDKHVVLGETNAFYTELANKLKVALSCNRKWEYIFNPIYLNAKILGLKAEIGAKIYEAYHKQDKQSIQQHIIDLQQIEEDVRAFHKAIRKQWKIENKMSGLEVQDQRIGGMLARLEVIQDQLQAYLDGEIENIEELEYERLRFDCKTDEHPISIPGAWWHEIVTPNRMGRT